MPTIIESSEKFNKGWKGVLGYAFYDWASSPIPTLHATFIFAVYFTTQIAPENGTSLWGYMTALASLFVAIIAPFLGGYADAHSRRKLLLILSKTQINMLNQRNSGGGGGKSPGGGKNAPK